MNSLEQKLEDFFLGQLPGMSESKKQMAVKFLPWLIIVFGVLGTLAWLSSLRFFFGLVGLAPGYFISNIFMLIYFVLAPIMQALAVYGGYLMLNRKRRGWRIALYSLLLGVVSHICYLSILGLVIDFGFAYLLFQIRAYYTEETPDTDERSVIP